MQFVTRYRVRIQEFWFRKTVLNKNFQFVAQPISFLNCYVQSAHSKIIHTVSFDTVKK